jgi:hypothetical protein
MLPEGTHSSDSFHGAKFVNVIKEFHKNKCHIIDEIRVVLEMYSEGDKMKGYMSYCRIVRALRRMDDARVPKKTAFRYRSVLI